MSFNAAAIRMSAVSLGKNTHEKWERYSFRVAFTHDGSPGKRIDTDYHMGIGHATKRHGIEMAPKPNAKDVLCALFSDADCASGTFEDFCGDLGYDTDSRKALGTYLACQETGNRLRRFFGRDYEAAREAFRDE